jgi:hypothetical protein
VYVGIPPKKVERVRVINLTNLRHLKFAASPHAEQLGGKASKQQTTTTKNNAILHPSLYLLAPQQPEYLE